MAYREVIIPPSVRPESPSEFAPIDDQTVEFRPAFARGQSQRQTWGDPLWGLKMRYRGLAQSDRSLLKAAISEARGRGLNVRVAPGIPLRGSFPATELFTNNDFSNGTTGWTAQSGVLSVTDRVMRATANVGASVTALLQQPSLTAYVPYVLRGFARMSGAAVATNGPYLLDSASAGPGSNYSASDSTMKSVVMVASASGACSAYPTVMATGAYMAGDYADAYFASLSRCILVDGSPNGLTYSDQLNNGAWDQLSGASIVANNDVSPDGTTTGDVIHEDSATAAHFTGQIVTVSAAAADYSFSVALRAKGRSVAWIQLVEQTGVTSAIAWINLSTGVVGTTTVGTNWANIRAFSVNLGNSWFGFTIVARKTNAATSVIARIGSSNADGIQSYTGTNQDSIACWRATLAQSSVPTKLTQTTSAATTGTTQTGGSINVKGLPASTSGLLLPGDYIEINGELKRVTAALDSDAAGLGYLKFRPGLAAVASNDDPIIVNSPMGRFMIQSVRELENWGVYTDFELDLIEAPQ